MKVQSFLALGGPLNGHRVTEQYAGPEYGQFNNAVGGGKHTVKQGLDWVTIRRDTCVLVFLPLIEKEVKRWPRKRSLAY